MIKVGDKVKVLQKDFDGITEEVGAILKVVRAYEVSDGYTFYTNTTKSANPYNEDPTWIFGSDSFKNGGLMLIETEPTLEEIANKVMEDNKELFQNLAKSEELDKSVDFKRKRLEYLKKATVGNNWVRLTSADIELFKEKY